MIEVKNLTKAFGAKLAVNDVSFGVQRGEVLGFLGPNGAGKSTTMRMITGFIPPTDGDVVVGGFNIGADPIPARRLIGYLPENAPSYADMTVQGFLNFTAELRGFRGAEKKRAVERVTEVFSRFRFASECRDAVERLSPSHLLCAVNHSRSSGPHPGRTDRRARPQPET